ncbi:hypothetical protein ABT001_30840 [Streptomyces sp. NPDC002793]|uniref:hypothetical protein n=1 Tax=Streptomyces sp. NPDC002793 TaxID=3154432 RepID=UPI00331E2A3E
MSSKIRLVPRAVTSRADIEQLAKQLGWTHHRTTQKGERTPFEITWLSPDRGAVIHWIEDHLVRVDYLLVQGPAVDPAISSLKSRIDFHSSESLQEVFDETRDSSALMDALHALGVYCSGPFDPHLFALFRWSMNDPDPLVRRVALLTASLTDWLEFIPLMDYVRTHDPSESVRAQAETILDVMSARAEAVHEPDQSSHREGG